MIGRQRGHHRKRWHSMMHGQHSLKFLAGHQHARTAVGNRTPLLRWPRARHGAAKSASPHPSRASQVREMLVIAPPRSVMAASRAGWWTVVPSIGRW